MSDGVEKSNAPSENARSSFPFGKLESRAIILVVGLAVVAVFIWLMVEQPWNNKNTDTSSTGNTTDNTTDNTNLDEPPIASMPAAVNPYESKKCWLPSGHKMYSGCGHMYSTENDWKVQCGYGGTQYEFIPDESEMGACSMNRGGIIYGGATAAGENCGKVYMSKR